MLEQFRGGQQAGVTEQRFAAGFVVGPSSHLHQASTAILLTVAVSLGRVAKAMGQATCIVLRQILVIAQLPDVMQLAGLMAGLGEKRSHAQAGYDAVLAHGRVECGNKNAGFAAGVREDLLQLFFSDRHCLSP
ncbi:hypothetical protein D3C76_962820 [compost metagenome]